MATKSFVSQHVKTIVLAKLSKQLQQITPRIVPQAIVRPPWNSDAALVKPRQPQRPPGLRKMFSAWSEQGMDNGAWFWKHGPKLERDDTVVWNNGIWLMGHAYGPKDRYKVLWLEQGEWQATKWLTSEKSILAAVAAARLTGGV
jgi:hypothetical protein